MTLSKASSESSVLPLRWSVRKGERGYTTVPRRRSFPFPWKSRRSSGLAVSSFSIWPTPAPPSIGARWPGSAMRYLVARDAVFGFAEMSSVCARRSFAGWSTGYSYAAARSRWSTPDSTAASRRRLDSACSRRDDASAAADSFGCFGSGAAAFFTAADFGAAAFDAGDFFDDAAAAAFAFFGGGGSSLSLPLYSSSSSSSSSSASLESPPPSSSSVGATLLSSSPQPGEPSSSSSSLSEFSFSA